MRNETFLRGGYPTDADGLVELRMTYTGFYEGASTLPLAGPQRTGADGRARVCVWTGRAPHIHTMVHVGWAASANGTLVSHAGAVAHVGQFFFPEGWNDRVFARAPYTANTNRRTLNKDDWILEEAGAGGNNAYIECVWTHSVRWWVWALMGR